MQNNNEKNRKLLLKFWLDEFEEILLDQKKMMKIIDIIKIFIPAVFGAYPSEYQVKSMMKELRSILL